MNYVEQILQQCATKGSEPALSLGGNGPDIITYRKLKEYLDGITNVLHGAGVRSGALYGVYCSNGLFGMTASLALNRLGALPVAFNSPASLNTVVCEAIITDQDLTGQHCPVWRITDGWLRTEPYFPAPLPFQDSAICRIAFTSGSTGTPKPIALTYKKLAVNLAQEDISTGPLFTEATSRLNYIGIGTLYGYRTMVRTLVQGGLYCFRDTDIAREARRIELYRVQVLIVSPGQMLMFLRFARQNPGAFSSLKLIVSAGGPLAPALATHMQQFVCRNLIHTYGASEGGALAAAPVETLDLRKGQVGYVNSKIEVSVVDPETKEPITGSLGLLRMRGPGVITSYYGQTADQDARFEGGWFYPGDIASLSSDGMLAITTREDGIVNLGGVKSTAEKIEAALRSAPGVSDVAVAFATNELGITRPRALIVPAEGWSETAFWSYCDASIFTNFRPSRIALTSAMPYGTSGKIDRNAVKTLLNSATPVSQPRGVS